MTTLTLDQLLDGARYHADLALRAYTNDESRAILVNAAFSMEHLSKALLFQTNPAFLVDLRNGHFDSLLHLTGHGEKATRLSTPRTIGAKEALARVSKIISIGAPRPPLDQLIEIRDGIVHVAAFAEASTLELLIAFLRYCDEVYGALDVPDVDRWGRHCDLVTKLVGQSWSAVQLEVHRKITAAQGNLRELMDKIPESEQAAVIEARQAVLRPFAHRPFLTVGGQRSIGELMDCPACHHPGALCVVVIEEEYDLPKELGPMDRIEEVASLTGVYLNPRGLVCHVCGLSLGSADELSVAGVPTRLEITDNVRTFLPDPKAGLNLPGLDPRDLV